MTTNNLDKMKTLFFGWKVGQRIEVTELHDLTIADRNMTKEDWDTSAINPEDASRAVREYLDVLDDAAFGAASEVDPKLTSHSDPSSQWTAARERPASVAYSTN